MKKIYLYSLEPGFVKSCVMSELAKSKRRYVGLQVINVVAYLFLGANTALVDGQLLDGIKILIELKYGSSGSTTKAGIGLIAMGSGPYVAGTMGGIFSAIALSTASKATGQAVIAMGESSSTTGNRPIVIGDLSNINGANPLVLGVNASITVNNALTLYDKAAVSFTNIVAVGAGSCATAISSTAANTVGNAIVTGKTLTVTHAQTNCVTAVGSRQIQGEVYAALATTPKDAINGAQLFAVARTQDASVSALGSTAAGAMEDAGRSAIARRSLKKFFSRIQKFVKNR